MSGQSIRDALRPLATRLGGAVREHEVLRIAASIHGKDPIASAEAARREVLAWAQNRSGGRLPPEAWRYESFEHLSGGRNSVGVRLENDGSDIWAIRADDPDKEVPGRVWTTEVVVGTRAGQRARFSARQLVSTGEAELNIEPHTPNFVQQVSEVCGLSREDYDLEATPWVIESADDTDRLIELLIDQARALPVFVLTVPDGAPETNRPLVHASDLSKAVLGIAHVVVLPAGFTWALTDRFGRFRSVFGGAVRAYLPGFSETADPYEHRLILAESLSAGVGIDRSVRWMRSAAAAESVRRNRLGRDVLAFVAIKNAALKARQESLSSGGASESEQLAAAFSRIQALEAAAGDANTTLDYFDSETTKAVERAVAAEALLRASGYRIQQLRAQFEASGANPDVESPLPETWAEFSDWCDSYLAGRVSLSPAARRGAKSPLFDDVGLAARCLIWLATDYRHGRLNGGEGDFRDKVIEPGVRNSPCGSDEFDLDWQGRRHSADWHIKSGGNTRDPQRCLRIYYFWEPETQQVVVADMPAHRDTGAS